MIRVTFILGGFTGFDGTLTSAGMFVLKGMIERRFGLFCTSYDWGFYKKAEAAIKVNAEKGYKNIVIVYSGGGSRVTWMDDPPIDLLIAYDPSPSWQMVNPIRSSIKRAVTYQNSSPFFFGLGGGELKGPQVTVVSIAQQHALVQFNQELHNRTLQEIAKV